MVTKKGNGTREPLRQHSAVINRYAVAELVAGRRIVWKGVADRPPLLENILQSGRVQDRRPVGDAADHHRGAALGKRRPQALSTMSA
jgi:hypothetical protein